MVTAIPLALSSLGIMRRFGGSCRTASPLDRGQHQARAECAALLPAVLRTGTRKTAHEFRSRRAVLAGPRSSFCITGRLIVHFARRDRSAPLQAARKGTSDLVDYPAMCRPTPSLTGSR